jgi:hypothetical protein
LIGYSGTNCEIGESMLDQCLLLYCNLLFFVPPAGPIAEGLSIAFTSTSSLAKTTEYQNAIIYLNLSNNSAFASYKVWLALTCPNYVSPYSFAVGVDFRVQPKFQQLSW